MTRLNKIGFEAEGNRERKRLYSEDTGKMFWEKLMNSRVRRRLLFLIALFYISEVVFIVREEASKAPWRLLVCVVTRLVRSERTTEGVTVKDHAERSSLTLVVSQKNKERRRPNKK